MSGHHRLRILRQADAHELPHRSATRLRVFRARRPAHHADLPVDRRVHGGRGGDRIVVGCVEPQRDRARARRRRRGRRPASADRPRRRTRRRTRPLRGRRTGSSYSTSPRSGSPDTGTEARRSPTPGSWPTTPDGRHRGEPVAWNMPRPGLCRVNGRCAWSDGSQVGCSSA